MEKQFDERKAKMIKNQQLRKLPGALKTEEENKLRSVSGKLEKAKDKLKLLLVKADGETIKDHIPEAAREKCVDALSKASNIVLEIKHAISLKHRKHFKTNYSAGKQSLTSTKEMVSLLQAIVDSLRAA